jgi:hypothetical protein
MVRITDPDRSRAFYEALGFRFAIELDIVRGGEIEATNCFLTRFWRGISGWPWPGRESWPAP